jgi:hypothetical protein
MTCGTLGKHLLFWMFSDIAGNPYYGDLGIYTSVVQVV